MTFFSRKDDGEECAMKLILGIIPETWIDAHIRFIDSGLTWRELLSRIRSLAAKTGRARCTDEELVLPGETRIYESGKGRMPRPSDPSPGQRKAHNDYSLLSGEHKNEADSNRTND